MSGKDQEVISAEGENLLNPFTPCPFDASVWELEPKEVFAEFKKLYESRMERIALEGCDDSELKIAALEEWVQELMKQNAMLIDVVSELERETRGRVSLLQSRLKCTARAARDAMLQLQDCEAMASAERVAAQTHSLKTTSDLTLLEKEQRKLKEQVAGLRCDASALIHFVKKVVESGEWSTSEASLNVVPQRELQSPVKEMLRETKDDRTVESPYQNCKTLDFKISNAALMQEVVEKDSVIARLEAEVTHLSQELSLCESAHVIEELGSCLNRSNENTVCQLQKELKRAKEENEKNICIISTVKEELVETRKRNAELQRHIMELEKVAQETRDVLTKEVAEKHDLVVLLRAEVGRLEEALHQASMQARFKDDIIKEMRQEIRSCRAKTSGV